MHNNNESNNDEYDDEDFTFEDIMEFLEEEIAKSEQYQELNLDE